MKLLYVGLFRASSLTQVKSGSFALSSRHEVLVPGGVCVL